MLLTMLLIAIAFDIAANVFDITMTRRGIVKGTGVEAHTFLLGSDKPSKPRLYVRDAIVYVVPEVVLALLLIHNPAAYGAALAASGSPQ